MRNIQAKMMSEMSSTFAIQSTLCILFSLITLQEANKEVSPVRATVGDCVILDLENWTPTTHIHVTWKKDNSQVAKMKGQPATGSGTYSHRSHAFINGSLSLCPTQLRDEGQYTAEVFHENGTHLHTQRTQLALSEQRITSTYDFPIRFFILIGIYAAVFMVVLGSLIWHFGKCKQKPVHWKTRSFRHESVRSYDFAESREQALSSDDKVNGSSTTQKPEALGSMEEGQEALTKNLEEPATAAVTSLTTEHPVPLNISTFQGKGKSLAMDGRECVSTVTKE